MLFFMFFSTSIFMAIMDDLPNGSFENGTIEPQGWALSRGIGIWENEGYDSQHSISVIGTGQDSNYWLCKDFKLLPRQKYRISFASRVSPDASGGTVITGSNVVNRDYSIGTKWEKRNFVFTTPDDTKEAFLRFGQWQKSGKAWFDNIEIKPVITLHRRFGDLELGNGEIIQKNSYKFRPDFYGEGSNSSRALLSHTAGFNSNRWLISGNSEVIYHHQIGHLNQNKAEVTLEIGYYQGGSCAIEASLDGKNWLLIGTLSGLENGTFGIPEALLPAKEIFIKLRGIQAQLQIYGYEYEAEIDGIELEIVGHTRYLDVLKSSDDIDVQVISMGDTKPDSMNLRVTIS